MAGSDDASDSPSLRKLKRDLKGVVGSERCLDQPARLLVYECDGLTRFKTTPLAVVLPESTEEVSEILRLCLAAGIPVTPRGAGTCLSGGATVRAGGVIIELARMRRILKVDPENRLAVVQPGVVNVTLSEAARPSGLCYAPDPSSQAVCTIGGNVTENAGGPHCLKYGATTNHILKVKVVLPGGEVADFEAPAPGRRGLDLRGLFLGSEGTLGITTEITCRLVPLPRAIETLLASFRDLETACQAVSNIIAAGIVPAALEALDERTIAAVEASVYRAGYPKDAGAVLLVELDGHPREVSLDVERVSRILKQNQALRVETAADPEQRARLWKGRKGAFGAMGRLAPDLHVQDTVVPRSKLPEVLAKVCAICDELDLVLANVFHAGDGNLHPNISYDGRNKEEVERVLEAGHRIVRVCVDAGGALSGEHGIGLEKQEYMPLIFGDDDLETMRRVRRVFDPEGIMNPGKLLPTPSACAEMKALPRAPGESA